jgi:hypothetical protein
MFRAIGEAQLPGCWTGETAMTTTERKVIKAKVGLLELPKQLGKLIDAGR